VDKIFVIELLKEVNYEIEHDIEVTPDLP